MATIQEREMSTWDREDIFRVFNGASLDDVMDALAVVHTAPKYSIRVLGRETDTLAAHSLIWPLYKKGVIKEQDSLMIGQAKAKTVIDYYRAHKKSCNQALERWNS